MKTSKIFRHNIRKFSLPAHGRKGILNNSIMPKDSDEYKEMLHKSHGLYELTLNLRQRCDIELIMNGGFSPLDGFMTSKQYNGVCKDMKLPDGTIFPLPICLDINEKQVLEIEKGGYQEVLLRDEEGNMIAVMSVDDIFPANKKLETNKVFGGDLEHPAVQYLNYSTNNMYIGGELFGFQLPHHYDYSSLRQTPVQLRKIFQKKGWEKIVAFQTRNPMHRAHIELTKMALNDKDMNLLIHPVVGMTKPGDIDHHTRVKCIKSIIGRYPKNKVMCSVLPLAMRMAGPREAIWHAIVRKNYGCTHFILGRDHAGPGSNSKGEDFYGPYEARDFALEHEKQLGMKFLPFEMMVYSSKQDKYFPISSFPKDEKPLKLSGTEVRRRLATGEDIPSWFSYPEVVEILRKQHPDKTKQGFTLFFTGFSGSGKSTVANALVCKLLELQDRRVTLLDGDFVRKLISSELGFSDEHRNLNIKRIGYISSLVAKSGGISVAAPIAPFETSRKFCRDLCNASSGGGSFLEIHVSTSIDVCSQRDRKGLYQKQKLGKLKGLTGVDAPYENPKNPEITLDTSKLSVEQSVNKIIEELQTIGFLPKPKAMTDSE